MTTSVTGRLVTPEWTFGDRVRRIRRTAGLSQAEFARRIGVGDRSLSQWESDRNRPGDIVRVAVAIYREFQVPPEWTLGLNDGTSLPRLDSNQQPFGFPSRAGFATAA